MKESAEALDGWGLLVYTGDKKETFLSATGTSVAVGISPNCNGHILPHKKLHTIKIVSNNTVSLDVVLICVCATDIPSISSSITTDEAVQRFNDKMLPRLHLHCRPADRLFPPFKTTHLILSENTEMDKQTSTSALGHDWMFQAVVQVTRCLRGNKQPGVVYLLCAIRQWGCC